MPGTILSDPNALSTPDGTYLLIADEVSYGGALWSGDIASDSLSIRGIPRGPPDIFDYGKIAYDPLRDIIYVVARGAFDDGQRGVNIFASRHNSRFSRVELPGLSYPLYDSIDTTPDGLLRVVSHTAERIKLLRFSEELSEMTVVDGPEFSPTYGRVSAESELFWSVNKGPSIQIDKSDRHPGRIYLLWAQDQIPKFGYGLNFDVFLSYSDNDGGTWSAPTKVNDDDTLGDQVFPSIRIDSEGLVHVAFLDKRESPDAAVYDVYYAKISDDVVSQNIRVNPRHIPNEVADGTRDPGDYLNMLVVYPWKVYVSYPCKGAEKPGDACVTALDPRRVPFPGEFTRGDSNQNFIIDISDAINILGYLFTGDSTVTCKDAADVNDDGTIDLSDALYLLDYLFKSEHQPPSPFPQPGHDNTEDKLNCN